LTATSGRFLGRALAGELLAHLGQPLVRGLPRRLLSLQLATGVLRGPLGRSQPRVGVIGCTLGCRPCGALTRQDLQGLVRIADIAGAAGMHRLHAHHPRLASRLRAGLIVRHDHTVRAVHPGQRCRQGNPQGRHAGQQGRHLRDLP
jgi:hypothetical protein